MYQFNVFKIGGTDLRGGWVWQVTKDVGPITVVTAKSGHQYPTAEAAKQDFHDMCAFFAKSGSSTPPAA